MSELEQLKALLRESVAIIKSLQQENDQLREHNEQLSQDKALEKNVAVASEKQEDLAERIRDFQARHRRVDSKLTVGSYDFESKKWRST